jgi:hypothetical protein
MVALPLSFHWLLVQVNPLTVGAPAPQLAGAEPPPDEAVGLGLGLGLGEGLGDGDGDGVGVPQLARGVQLSHQPLRMLAQLPSRLSMAHLQSKGCKRGHVVRWAQPHRAVVLVSCSLPQAAQLTKPGSCRRAGARSRSHLCGSEGEHLCQPRPCLPPCSGAAWSSRRGAALTVRGAVVGPRGGALAAGGRARGAPAVVCGRIGLGHRQGQRRGRWRRRAGAHGRGRG